MANNRELSQFASFVEVGISSIGFTTSVGIGKTNPQFNLDVAGDINFTGTFYQGGTQFIASRWSATGSDIYRLSKVGINTSIVPSALTVNGDVYVSGISTLGITTATNLTSQSLVVSGISTLGITSATNLTSQSLVVSGISTLGITSTTNLTSQSLVVSGISTLGITSATNLTSQSLVVSGISTFTNGPILVGTATSTGTASQPLQVDGGAYVSGNFGIGTTNVVSQGGFTLKSQISGGYLKFDTNNGILWDNAVGATNISGFGGSSGYIQFSPGNVRPLRYSTGRVESNFSDLSPGSGGSDAKIDLGSSGNRFRYIWSTGPTFIGAAASTGTASQLLQVDGGAYVSGNIGIGTTNPTAKLSIGSVSGFQDTITTVATTAVTTIDSFATATFRSTRAQVQITQSTNYQASDVLIIHDGTTASIVEYGSIATNDYLGTFSASVSGGNCLLRINMSSATSATVKVLSQRITV